MTDFSILQGKKATYFTLGCKLNFSETSSVARDLQRYGVVTVHDGECADICIINTCSVTEVADHKCRQAISKMVRRHPGSIVVVVGCYAQLQPQRVSSIQGVDVVLGAEEKGRVVEHLVSALCNREKITSTTSLQEIRSFAPSCSCGDRTRYFLKVQDGCDYYCTYCTIPYARGRSRNGSIESLVSQATQVANDGGKEIVITGVNIGDFGKTTGETFLELIKALDQVSGIERYRISSIEPNLLTDDVIMFCAGSRAFMPHFHIPLQSGSDSVLRLMHRRYDTCLFASKVARIKELMPDAFIGVDVIVGTRGETPQLFDETERFIRQLDISQLHVFSYSERPGTLALKIPYTVSHEDKHERSQRLLALSSEKLNAFYRRFVGTEQYVLWEHSRRNGVYEGFTPNYIRVKTMDESSLDNTITKIRIDEANICIDT